MTSLNPDLILTNARVMTLDPHYPGGKTVLIRAGRILSVNNEDLTGSRRRGLRVIDCRGGTVLPGFIDAHCHLRAYAQSLVTLSLEPRAGIRSISDMQKAIRRFSRSYPPGAWISGRGYDEFHLAEKRHPTRHDLDEALSTHPVRISHRSGQAHVLNSLALSLAGISPATPDPPDGIIDRDTATGEPTGLLYGMGGFLAERAPKLPADACREGIRRANANLLASGITSLQDASSQNSLKDWQTLTGWKKEGLLLPRLRMMLGFQALQDYQKGLFSPSLPESELALGGVKIMIHETTGRLLPEAAELKEMVLEIHRLGLQAALHAVEEHHIEAACLAMEYALRKYPRTDHRHRIEHCSLCPPALARRLNSLGFMVVTQPNFVYYHGERYLKTVPPAQLKHLYPLATLLRAGISVAGSSDFPVAPPDILKGIYAALSRRCETGEILQLEERILPQEALRLYTHNAARSAFEEKEKGTIIPGKLADLVVLDGDPTALPEKEIIDIGVFMTIINGKVVWERDNYS